MNLSLSVSDHLSDGTYYQNRSDQVLACMYTKVIEEFTEYWHVCMQEH